MSLSESEDTFNSTSIGAPQVIDVRGTDREIGAQHGELARGLHEGMLAFYGDFWERLRQLGAAILPAGWDLFERAALPALRRTFRDGGESEIRERVAGIASVFPARMREVDLPTALILSDLLPYLQAWTHRLGLVSSHEVSVPHFGCSSAIARRGGFTFARNLDFPGTGFWDRFPVIQVTRKTGVLRYIGFTTAGIPFGGITGINEAGIAVALHQHYGPVSLRGELPFSIAERILQRARTFEDAQEILYRARVRASWAFWLVDGFGRRACVVEKTPKGQSARFFDDEHPSGAHSNFFHAGELQAREFTASAKMLWDNHARERRLAQLAGEGGGVAAAARALGDHWDPYWQSEKLLNRTVAQVYNVQSLVFDFETFSVWFASGRSPVQLERYWKWDLGALFVGRGVTPTESVPGFAFRDPGLATAKRTLTEAFGATMRGDFAGALRGVEAAHGAASARGSSLETAALAGVMRAKGGDLAGAVDVLSAAIAQAEARLSALGRRRPPPEFYEAKLFRARFRELRGERSAAAREYRALVDDPELEDRYIRRVARRAAPYTAAQLRRLMIPFSTYVGFE